MAPQHQSDYRFQLCVCGSDGASEHGSILHIIQLCSLRAVSIITHRDTRSRTSTESLNICRMKSGNKFMFVNFYFLLVGLCVSFIKICSGSLRSCPVFNWCVQYQKGMWYWIFLLVFLNLKIGERLLKQILAVWMIVMDTDTDRKIQTQCGACKRESGTLLA